MALPQSLTLLSALPVWQQSSVLLPDGHKDPQWFNDCGETCVAMAIAAIRGTPIGPGSIRANLGGPGRSGLSNGNALVQACTYYRVQAHVATPKPEELQGFLTAWSSRHMPTIVLGYWPTPGGVLHWQLTTAGGQEWSYINPWSGAKSWLDWGAAEPLYGLEVVAFDEVVRFNASKVLLPY